MTSVYPLVSVCIPAYNCTRHIKEALLSVLEQSYPNLEIIVVDDGSTDDTLTKLQEWKDPRIKILQQQNKGASAARNLAVQNSQGEFIQFLDADDILSKSKIEYQVERLVNNPSKLAVCSTVHFDDGGSCYDFRPSAYEDAFLYDTDDPTDFYIRLIGGYNFKASMVQTAAWLTHREIICKAGPWNETITVDDDGEFFCRVILASSGIVKSDGLVYYRKYPFTSANLSSQTSHQAMTSLVNSALLKEAHLFSLNKSKQAKKAIFRQLIDLQIQCYLKEPALYNTLTWKLKHFPKWRFKPRLGGRFINLISDVLGWKFAKRIQLFYHQLRPSIGIER